MEKTINFNIPEGYVIDKEESTNTNIVLKLSESVKPKSWEEYCEKMKGKISYYMDSSGKIMASNFWACTYLPEFETKEEVKAFAAYSKLIKLRKQWIGDWKPNWKDNSKKYVICVQENKVVTRFMINTAHCLSFPTPEMRDEFFDCFKDYLEQAKTLL